MNNIWNRSINLISGLNWAKSYGHCNVDIYCLKSRLHCAKLRTQLFKTFTANAYEFRVNIAMKAIYVNAEQLLITAIDYYFGPQLHNTNRFNWSIPLQLVGQHAYCRWLIFCNVFVNCGQSIQMQHSIRIQWPSPSTVRQLKWYPKIKRIKSNRKHSCIIGILNWIKMISKIIT